MTGQALDSVIIKFCVNHNKYITNCQDCKNALNLYCYHKYKNENIYCEKCDKYIKKFSYKKHLKSQKHTQEKI